MAKTQVIDGTKAAPLANLKCRNCDGYYFQGPILAGTISEDGEFHADPARTQYHCLGCHTIQPVSDMRVRVSLAAEL